MVLFSILKLHEAEEEINSWIPALSAMKTKKICKALYGHWNLYIQSQSEDNNKTHHQSH